MKKLFLGLTISCVALFLAVTAFFSVPASPVVAQPPTSTPMFSPQIYSDLYQPVATTHPLTHRVNWNEYVWAPFGVNSRQFKWSSSGSAYTMANNAVSAWNNVLVPTVGQAVYEPNPDINGTDLMFYMANCPGTSATGCFGVTAYQTHGTFAVRLWKTASIYVRVFPASGSWGPGMQQTIFTHEMGHAWGLGDMYNISSPSCTSGASTIMDTGYYNGSNQLVPCDSYTITSTDQSRLNDFYAAGNYTYSSITGGSTINAVWRDTVWNDWNMIAYWDSLPIGGTEWDPFAYKLPIGGNGSHYSVPRAQLPTYNLSINPGSYGVPHNRYIRVCVRPNIDDTTIINEVCSPSVYW